VTAHLEPRWKRSQAMPLVEGALVLWLLYGLALHPRAKQNCGLRRVQPCAQVCVQKIQSTSHLPVALGTLHRRLCAGTPGKGVCLQEPRRAGRRSLSTFLPTRRSRVSCPARRSMYGCQTLRVQSIRRCILKENEAGVKPLMSSTLKPSTGKNVTTA